MGKYEKIKLEIAKRFPHVIWRLGQGANYADVEINLEDILMLFNEKRGFEVSVGHNCLKFFKRRGKRNLVYWRLGKPLSQQKKETIVFFYKMLE